MESTRCQEWPFQLIGSAHAAQLHDSIKAGWCCRVPSSSACFLVSRDPVLQRAGTNMGEGEFSSSSTVPASPRIAQQHVNSAVNTRRRARLHSSLEPGILGNGELDSRCRASACQELSVVAPLPQNTPFPLHPTPAAALPQGRQWTTTASPQTCSRPGSSGDGRTSAPKRPRKTLTTCRRDRRRPFPRTGPWGSCRASCPRHASN